MSPGIGLMKRRLEKEKMQFLAVSGIAKKYNVDSRTIQNFRNKIS